MRSLTGMDARIGYPTEHLANTNDLDALASPMYATGIGLVLKGFESLEGLKPWEQTENAIASDKNPEAAQKNTKEKQEKIRTHSSGQKRGDFFKSILEPVKKFFDDSED